MKKLLDTKKILITALFFSIALFALPLSSFGGGAFVHHYEGDIEGLYFTFGEDAGLPVSLPDLGEVTVLDTLVEASGRETLIITPFGRYIYHAKLRGGIEGSETGKIYASAISEEWGELPLVFEFESASLSENFFIQGDIPEDPLEIEVPPDVNLFFKVKGARLIEPMPIDDSFNLMFKIRRGDLQFIMMW